MDKTATTSSDIPIILFRDPAVLRDLIKHENDLINHRITWFVTIQGLLFAALGFTWGKQDAKQLITVLCGLGFLTSVSTGFVLWGGAKAISQLSKEMKKISQPIIGRCAGIEKYAYPWYSFPVLFGLTWITILLVIL